MVPSCKLKFYFATALLATLSVSAQQSRSNQIDTINEPFHLSWTKNQTRFDIVFSPKAPLKNVIKLETVATNSLANALVSCTGYHACLFKNDTFVQAYELNNRMEAHRIVFISSVDKKPSAPNQKSTTSSTLKQDCNDSEIVIDTFCSTHWNPPTHLYDNRCNHVIEWHSPFSCPDHTKNYERPCYIYDANSKLIDLTPWILSNSSSHEIDTSSFNGTVKKFNLNVCNEAYKSCGPNTCSCYEGGDGMVESGFNNLTSIKYDSKEKTVLLTSLGQYNEHCSDHRVRTVTRFICKDKVIRHTKPKLIRSNACENIIEWQTIHACPVSDFKVAATSCAFKYEPLDIDIDLKQLTKGANTVEIDNINLNGKDKSMMLSMCQGLNGADLSCEGKKASSATACLYDSSSKLTSKNSTNSEIVGNIGKSFIRLGDGKLYLESFAKNKTCTVPMGPTFNITRQVGTRVEFFCSTNDDHMPTYLGYEDCIYIFEWGSGIMCSQEHFSFNELTKDASISNSATRNQSTTVPNFNPHENNHGSKLSDKELKIDMNQSSKSAHNMHQETLNDSKDMIGPREQSNDNKLSEQTKQSSETSHSKPASNDNQNKPAAPTAENKVTTKEPEVKPIVQPPNGSKMNKLHKFFMIGLIIMSLAAFIVVIFILDKKTQLGLPLGNIRRQARQAFQPQPVPYTRVDQFNDLDL